MFPLGIRAWVDNTMFYTNAFWVSAERETRSGTVHFYDEKKRLETDIYMLITNAQAMNGDIYEYDILKGPDNDFYIVAFDSENGQYTGFGLRKEGNISISSDMFIYEIIGNPLENPDLVENCCLPVQVKTEVNKLLLVSAKPIDYSKDLIDEADMSEVDYDESAEEAERDMEEELKRNLDVSLVLDKGAVIIPTLEGDITDEYVDWVYSMAEGEAERNKTPDYLVEDNIIIIYVESDYKAKSKLGAYAFEIEWAGSKISDAGQTKNINNQQTSELNAIVKALCTIREPSQIKLYSTSKYVVAPFEKGWIYQWEKNDWKKDRSKDKIKNSSLFSKLLSLTRIHDVEFDLVRDIKENKSLANCRESARCVLA